MHSFMYGDKTLKSVNGNFTINEEKNNKKKKVIYILSCSVWEKEKVRVKEAYAFFKVNCLISLSFLSVKNVPKGINDATKSSVL